MARLASTYLITAYPLSTVPGLVRLAYIISNVFTPQLPAYREEGDNKGGPFFMFYYADDEVIAAVGRGGGAAFWKATTPAWDLQAGVDL